MQRGAFQAPDGAGGRSEYRGHRDADLQARGHQGRGHRRASGEIRAQPPAGEPPRQPGGMARGVEGLNTLPIWVGWGFGQKHEGGNCEMVGERRPIMDVTLGPWTAQHAEDKPLAEAMGDEAWKTVEK